MSVATPVGSQPTHPPPAARASLRGRVWVYVLVLLVSLSAVRVVSGASDITSSGLLRAALVSAIPIALAGLGGLWSERAGVVNIGLEGMMILGTLGAGYYTYYWGFWAGLVGAMAFGAIGGALHALATVVFGVDHIVSGVAINIMAAGVAGFLAESFFTGLPGGGPTQSPSLTAMRPPSITIPGLSDAAESVAGHQWFVISDLAAVVSAATASMSVFTLLALGIIAGTGWVLWRTAFGLRLRSTGESPSAAETLGVDVYRYKFIAVTVSGALAGLAGAYLALIASSGYQNGQTGGRGYIGLAAMIFGNWRPGGLLTGSLLFGYTDAARLRSGGESIHALLLLLGVALVGLAIWQWRHQRTVSATVTSGLGVLLLVWYVSTDTIPDEFTQMAPPVMTLLVLALFAQRLRMPAADGQRFRRGSAG